MSGEEIQVGVRLTGDSTSLVAATQEAKTSEENLNASVKSLTDTSRNWQEVVARQNAQMAETTALMDAERDRAWALANGYKEVNGMMVKYAEEAVASGAASGAAAHGMSTVARELMVIGREATAGRLSRIPGSFMVLSSAATGLLGPIAMVAAGISGAALIWDEYANSAEKASQKAAKAAGKSTEEIEADLKGQITLLEARNRLAALGMTTLADDQASKLDQLHQTIVKDAALIADLRRSGAQEGIAGSVLGELETEYEAATGAYNKLSGLIGTRGELTKSLKDQQDALRKSEQSYRHLIQAAQSLDNELVSSEQTAFERRENNFQQMDAKLLALGSSGYAMRKKLEADHDAWVDAEQKKQSDKEFARHNLELQREQAYFDRLAAMKNQEVSGDANRAQLQEQRALIDWNKRHELAKQRQDYSLQEERAYQQAKADIITYYRDQELAQVPVVGAMMKAFNDANHKEELDSTLGYLTQLSALNAGHSRSMFELNKRAAEAQAVVHTYSAAVKAYDEAGGGWWGIPVALATIAYGMEQVAAIDKTQFGGGGANTGGGGVPSMATSPGLPVAIQGSAPLTSAQTQAPAQQTAPTTHLSLTLVGVDPNSSAPQFTYDQVVNQILPLLGKANGNGAVDMQVSFG